MSRFSKLITIIFLTILPITLFVYLYVSTKIITAPNKFQNSLLEVQLNKSKLKVTTKGNIISLTNSETNILTIPAISPQFIEESFSSWSKVPHTNGDILLIPPYNCSNLVLRIPMNYDRINEDLRIGDPNGPFLFCK